MKQNITTKLATVIGAAALCISSAKASDQGVYTKLDAGVSFISGLDALGYSTKWKTGFATNGAVGFNLQKHVGLELEGGYATNSLDSVGGANVNWTGADVSAWSGFGNLVLRSDLSETVSLFAAGGPGFVHYNFDILGASTSETVFAGQAKAGISFKVADNASVDLTYRSRFVGSSGGVSSCVNHQITAGFSIGF